MQIRIKLFISSMMLGLLIACSSSTGTTGKIVPPANVAAKSGPGYITVTWQDNSEDETGFVIYRSTDSDNALKSQADTRVGEVAANTETFIDTEVELETSYPIKTETFGLSYEVQSFTVGNSSTCSNPNEIITIPDTNLESAC